MPSVLWSYHTRVPSSRHPTFIFGFDLPNCTPVYIPVYIKFVLGCNCFSSNGLEGDEGNTLWGKNQLQVTQCIWLWWYNLHLVLSRARNSWTHWIHGEFLKGCLISLPCCIIYGIALIPLKWSVLQAKFLQCPLLDVYLFSKPGQLKWSAIVQLIWWEHPQL